MNVGWLQLSLVIVGLGWLGALAGPEDDLADLRRRLPASAAWEAWLREKGERPPPFEQLRRMPGLPDPLRFQDGRTVRTRPEWDARRKELLQLFEHYVTGTLPPAPDNLRVAAREASVENGVRVERVTLEFGPEHRARLRVELVSPGGRGPYPVFLTQDNHRRWALVAVSRGYLGCVYAGADSKDDTREWPRLWPEYDWATLVRRAWAASRCIDYLMTRPEVDRDRIALTGHSRNGKTALMGAAFDARVAAVISSSSGAGGACPFRYFSEVQFGEGIELITRTFPDWLHTRLRFFVGREAWLPVDQHELLACIAPRPCLISTALNDSVESAWAIEQTWRAVRPVYEMLGAPDALNLRYRDGGHSTRAEDIEAYLDWLDEKFRREGPVCGTEGQTPRAVADAPIYPTYDEWLRLSGERIDPGEYPLQPPGGMLAGATGGPITQPDEWFAKREEIRRRLEWTLGDAPPLATSDAGSYGAESRPTAMALGRGEVPSHLVKESLNFGNYLAGDLYYRTNVVGTNRRLPVLIWLHPVSVSNGYVAGYFRGEPPHLALTRSGYAVFAFDQIGNGTRIREARRFYGRHPHWSLLGKVVSDTRAAVDAMMQHPRIDSEQVFLAGYGTGGMAALVAAALDERVTSVICVAGFVPMRLDREDRGTGGVARWSRDWLWLPRLGAFVGHEDRIPCDFPEVLAMIAPRSVLLVTPGLDYHSTFADVVAGVDEARRVYALLGRSEGLVLQRTDDYNHFTPDLIWCLCGGETIR